MPIPYDLFREIVVVVVGGGGGGVEDGEGTLPLKY